MLEVIRKCFPALLASPEGQARMKAMIPTFDLDIKLPSNAAQFREYSQRADEILGLRAGGPRD